MAVTTKTGMAFLDQVYAMNNVDDCRSIYDKWASDYDADVNSETQNYVAPLLCAQAVLAASSADTLASATILDAGTGTGLTGVALAGLGARLIDGIDLSQGMLNIARKTGKFRNLDVADLSGPLAIKSETYDVVTCTGTFTHGHVGPDPAMAEFVRVLKSGGGLFVASVLDDIWVSGGYERVVRGLEREGRVEVVSTEKIDYRKAQGVKAVLLVVRKK
ncbi:methyltransferase domain-containing protein [Pseudovirgaria hyperparasitica]|uniref:Methyltransferase domain-containing protein n=1 Tax=Pseudovirgaria hyperparasitica TaxID=470096 RepID=A0A6A6WFE1_9PEZI|nr:methyltransferase domain-containing protein [Pseudovirgaria hyperparasitica]KAF2759831.1 methyltransferase domain-containing protein [Pseudovirgaria hyperparasitica]